MTPKENRLEERPTEWFQRFGLSFRVQHIVLFVSTLLLIVTGVPLWCLRDWDLAWWSQTAPSSAHLLELSRLVHRIAAALLTAVSLLHVIYTVYTREGRREFVALLPMPKDFLDVMQNSLYFLHLSDKRPRYGRYTYYEKFDYWAVYWGCVIMIGTGFVLWFDGWAAEYVSWFPYSLASLIHADEAILATLALRVTPQPGSPNLTVMCALLFVPLYDTILAIVRRGLNGNGIMAADRGHIHHRLLDRGLGVWGSLALLAALSLTAGFASCFAILTGQELVAWVALLAVALLCAQFQLFGHREWAMVKDRLTWPRWRGKVAEYAPLPKERSASNLVTRTANETKGKRKQLDGLPQPQTSLPLGINVRLAGAQNASAATPGKKYVELLG